MKITYSWVTQDPFGCGPNACHLALLLVSQTSPRVSTLQVLPWKSTQPLGISYTSIKHKELGGRFLETINYCTSVNY